MRKSSLRKVPIAWPALSRTTTGTRTRFTLTRNGATDEEEAGNGAGGGVCGSVAEFVESCVTRSAGCCALVVAAKAIAAYAEHRAMRNRKRAMKPGNEDVRIF